MTLEETSEVMDLLTIAYPKFKRGLSQDEKVSTAKLWAAMFVDDDVKIVLAAVKALIATKTDDWPPSIGAVKEKIRLISEPQEMTEQEAWALVSRAIRNSGYKSESEFERLPPTVRRLVGSPSQLRDWGMLEERQIGTVVASNFMRSYRARVKSDKEIAALPSDVRRMLVQTAEKLMLE